MCLQVPGHMPLSQLLGPGCFGMQGHNEGIILHSDGNRVTMRPIAAHSVLVL